MAKKYPQIPHTIRLTRHRRYEVLYTNDFMDGATLGECRIEPPQIVIRAKQSPKETFSCCIHEVIHAVDFEEEIGLTEAQVLKLERGLLRLLTLNKWI